jgi:aryl-alcohol dehydrogenase-like predicted oxidoreductase
VSAAASYRQLGRSALEVFPICLGGNVFGWTVPEHSAFPILDAYLEAGGNFIDTADQYSTWAPGNRGGESERILGAWLQSRQCRDEVVLATKVGSGSDDIPPGLRREVIAAGCEKSLQRLGVSEIDLYYAHRDDANTPLEETLLAFEQLLDSGKVRNIAASNYSAVRLRSALEISNAKDLPTYSAVQPPLSLVSRAEFNEVLPVCVDAELGIATYAALASGFLTGKYAPGRTLPSTPRAAGVASRYLSDPDSVAILEAARRVAHRLGATVAQVAVAWAIAQPGVTSAIVSVTSVPQLTERLGALALQLAEADLRELSLAA